MKSRSKVKKLVITLVVLAAVTLAAIGIAPALAQRGAGEVDVYPVSDLTTSADWITDTQIEGFVTSDENQSVYISSTQQVTEVYVVQGQTVKAGDPILAFDTTLTDLELDRQRIEVEQIKLDIQDAEKELREIGTLRVGSNSATTDYSTSYTPPDDFNVVDETPEPSGEGLVPVSSLPYELAREAVGTWDDPFVYLWNDECLFSQSFFRELVTIAAQRREALSQEEENLPEEPGAENAENVESAENVETAENVESVESGKNVYVIFETRDFDAVNGELLQVWEMELTPDGEGGDCSFRMIDPVYPGTGEEAEDSADGMQDGYEQDIYEQDSFDAGADDGAVYTAAEIAEMREDCTKRIKELNRDLKMAELTYESLAYELSGGTVVSKLDGVVATLIDADVARLEGMPMVVVSGGEGGYYVTAALGEMALETLAVGDAVTVQSWENYKEMEGCITEISEYPDESGMFWSYSNGNRNISMYPFKVHVDASAGLREGEFVSIYPAGEGESSSALFLDIGFVRQENGKSYVYAVGEDGRLERRDVKTGRNLWGSYIEILDGLTQEESIAFPYGRKTRDGAQVRQAEIQELYASMYS